MNKYAKMRRVHRKARDFLEKDGWLVYIVPHTRFSKDLFNLWDAVAIKHGIVAFVQIKSNSWGSVKPLREFAMKHNVLCMIIRYDDRKDIKIRYLP
jgi:hypothetical protein